MPPPAEGIAARLVAGPALRAQPDRRLVTLVREGYELAFEEIVRRYGKPLGRYAGAIVGNRADDVTQDAFSKALLALRRDGAEIELRPWLFRIVRNTALNELRDRPPSPELPEAISGGGNPAEELERREELADLMRRLQSLPEPQRAAIVMRELEGLGHEEIAAALGLSGGGARQAIYRARQALREGLGVLLPLPLLKAFLDGTAAAPVEAAAGSAGLGGAAGAGAALKAGAATVLVAGALGAGVAIDHGHHGDGPATARAQGVVAEGSAAKASSRQGAPGVQEASRETGGDGREGAGGGRPDSGRSGQNGGHGGSGVPRGGDRGTRDHAGSGDSHGGQSEPSGQTRGGDERHSGRSTDGSTGSGDGQSGDSGSGGGDHSGSGDGPAAPESGEETAAGEHSGSDSGPGSGDGGGGDVPDSEESSDSHDGEGFSVQMEPQPEETR